MEIERKFMLDKLPDNISDYPKKRVSQGYISTSPVIRIRRMGDGYYLTVKTGGGLAKEEFETPITKEQYDRLCNKAETRVIEKDRYFIPLAGGLTAELDIYYGFLDGLLTVEVEFESVADAEAFTPPEWFGEDVTENHAYSNSSLAVFGIP